MLRDAVLDFIKRENEDFIKRENDDFIKRETDVFIKRENEIDCEIQKLEDQKVNILNKLKDLKQEKVEVRLDHSLNHFKNKLFPSRRLRKEYSWSRKVSEVLKKTFKLDKFRPNQLTAINATLSKKHVLLVMPTGGGKSLVYQLPSLITGNISVVISPLIALIEDQLMALKRLGIAAATINSNTSKEEQTEIMAKMVNNQLSIIFITPEWIAKMEDFRNNLVTIYEGRRLTRFIIDEVHCCSQLGHDFRTDYLSLSLLKEQFPDVPILGLTATATLKVMDDVMKVLQIDDAVLITSPYNRPNLFYRVINKPEGRLASLDYLEKLLKEKYKDQSGIIYAGTQKECEDLARDLRERGISAAPYHANLEVDLKTEIHMNWTENTYQVVIATIAFGIGIDKPDVRFVIHYTVPKTLEGLYQESGRAGRDGEMADCILLFNLHDWLKNFAMTKNKKEEKSVTDVLQYCLDVSTCRRKMISKYFDGDWRSSDCSEGMCDHCKGTARTIQTYNIISCFNDILRCIQMADKKQANLTLKKLLDAWFQTGPKSLQSSRSKPQFTKEQAEHIMAFLLIKKCLTVKRGYTLVYTFPYIDVNIDEPFCSKKHNGKILMEYCGVLTGLPIYVDNTKPKDRCAEHNTSSSTKEVSQRTANDENSVLPSSTIMDLTSIDSDGDQVHEPRSQTSMQQETTHDKQNNAKSNDRVVENNTSSTEEKSLRSADDENPVECPIVGDLSGSSIIDLTNDDSDGDHVPSDVSVKQEKIPVKRTRRTSSLSSDDSLEEYEAEKKKIKEYLKKLICSPLV